MGFSQEMSRSIDTIVEHVARDYELDPSEFLFPEGDNLETRIEGLIFWYWEHVEEAAKKYGSSGCQKDVLEES
jgi:hypothetical protein